MDTRKPPPENKGCIILSPEENDRLFSSIGSKCYSQAAAVVQVFHTEPPSHSRWVKRYCGVASCVKDHYRKSYFIRIIDIDKRCCLWEQELYNHFEYKSPCSFFHSFEAENCMTGLSFADTNEAINFAGTVKKIVSNREQKRQEKRRNQIARPTNTGVAVASQGRSESMPSLNHKEEKSKHKKGKKLTKGDIGAPMDFRHMQHVGWSPDTGFEVSSNMDDDLKGFFNMAGISEKDLNDNDTRKFIYDFINDHGGIEKAKQEVLTARSNPPPPPPPAREAPPTPRNMRGSPSLRTTAPPPPPSISHLSNRQQNAYTGSPLRGPPSSTRGPPPPRPPPVSADHHQMTSAPPPPPPPPPSALVNNFTSAPPPPPPPPPAFSGGDSITAPTPPPPPLPGSGGGNSSANEATDARSALFDQIRKGKTLHHVELNGNIPNCNNSDGRDALLNQIRQGIELKPVAEDSRPVSGAAPMQGLAGALAKALQERSRVIQQTDESESDDEEDNYDDDWED